MHNVPKFQSGCAEFDSSTSRKKGSSSKADSDEEHLGPGPSKHFILGECLAFLASRSEPTVPSLKEVASFE